MWCIAEVIKIESYTLELEENLESIYSNSLILQIRKELQVG